MTKRLSMDQLNELVECFKAVKDPRVTGRSKHLLIDIIVISVVGILCGAEGIKNVWQFAVLKQKWLKKYLELPGGVPSEDTIARVLSIIDPAQMEKAFLEWVKIVIAEGETKTISLDGKYSKGTERTFNCGKKPLLIVSAYSHELGLSLVETEGLEGSEMDGAMTCLNLLDLKGILVEVDAGIGCASVVGKIVEKGGDYLVPLKGNQKTSRAEVIAALDVGKTKAQTAETEESCRGRDERRTCKLLPAKNLSEKFYERWPNAKTIFSISRERVEEDKSYLIQETGIDGKQTYRLNDNDLKYSEETVHYVSSRKLSGDEALKEARKHWAIENKVHWVLDVAFREDSCGVRAKALARTLSLVRKIALNIIRGSKTKGSVNSRMKQAGWSNEFLETLLFT